MSGRDKIHAERRGGRFTLCGRRLGSSVNSTEQAGRVTCLRCKANEGWSRFFNDTIRRNSGL